MTTDNDTDISPAIQELKKLHGLLLDHIEKNVTSGNIQPSGFNKARDTVISVLPGDRRREDGWYRWRKWEKRSDSIMHELEPTYKIQKYHEIFLAAEALSRDMDDIVLLMMHQVAHQAASVESTASYHKEWLQIWMERLFEIPKDAFERDDTMGWYKINKNKLGKSKVLVDRLASRLRPEKFDLFRLKLSKPTTTGKMYKWTCECGRPVVRTGGILRAVCQMCMHPYKMDMKGVPEAFAKRVPDDLKREVKP